jgi:hypothetical protein
MHALGMFCLQSVMCKNPHIDIVLVVISDMFCLFTLILTHLYTRGGQSEYKSKQTKHITNNIIKTISICGFLHITDCRQKVTMGLHMERVSCCNVNNQRSIYCLDSG